MQARLTTGRHKNSLVIVAQKKECHLTIMRMGCCENTWNQEISYLSCTSTNFKVRYRLGKISPLIYKFAIQLTLLKYCKALRKSFFPLGIHIIWINIPFTLSLKIRKTLIYFQIQYIHINIDHHKIYTLIFIYFCIYCN